MLFGYYSLAPFLFASLGLSAGEFGYSGIVLALATLVGSLLNKRLLGRGWTPASLIRLAAVLALGSGWLVWASQASLWFLLPTPANPNPAPARRRAVLTRQASSHGPADAC